MKLSHLLNKRIWNTKQSSPNKSIQPLILPHQTGQSAENLEAVSKNDQNRGKDIKRNKKV
jgi:hypothetical protein